MDEYNKQINRLIKTKYELENGTYKRISNKERLDNYNRTFKKFQLSFNSDLFVVNRTCTTDSKVGNTHKSFNARMKPITIKEMPLNSLGTIYRNRYIKFKIITELTMMTSIMFLGQDDNEDLTLIAIYNFENHYGTRDYKKLRYIYQKGKYIIVLEPFYKMFGSGEDGIRIEDPNEIIIFDDKEWVDKFLEAENKDESFKLLNDSQKDFEDLYKEAYKSLSLENYNLALAHFQKLKYLKQDEILFDLKIAECYFGLPYYTKTNEKCNEILNKIKIKANDENQYYMSTILLKLKSLIKLKKIEEAKKLLDEYNYIIEKNKKDFIIYEEEINNKIENMKGKFDFSEIFKKSKESLEINIGEYINEKLEIKFNPEKGICIFTKEKLDKGELLVVSKALAISDPNKKRNKKAQYIKFDNPDEEEFQKTKKLLEYRETDDLEELLSYKLSNYPEDFREIFYLFDGKNKNSNLEQRLKNTQINLRKIQNIIQFNFITLYFREKPISYGLWHFPSFFNHSCIPNCSHFGFGDILIIIATNEINPNSELNINYFYGDMLYHTRKNYSKIYYNFECNCELCKYEENKCKENKEKKVLDEYLKQLNTNIFPEIPDDEKGTTFNAILYQKDIAKMVKFIENNKKIFSCYEKSLLYLKCSFCMQFYDEYLSYEYLERALKYSENRNYYFEKLTLITMIVVSKILRSDIRLKSSCKRFKAFLEKYFPNQKKFIDIIMDEYLK